MNSHRLPRTVVPSRYDIRLEPDLSSATYAGEEIVAVRGPRRTDEVAVNAVELEIQALSGAGPRGRSSRARRRSTRAPSGSSLRFPRALEPGRVDA